MPFACPACAAPVGGSLERPLRRCRGCGAVVRSRPLDTDGPLRRYEVEAVGRPGTRVRLDVPWTPDEARRLRTWLLWSSVVTLGLVGVLYAAARFLRWPG